MQISNSTSDIDKYKLAVEKAGEDIKGNNTEISTNDAQIQENSNAQNTTSSKISSNEAQISKVGSDKSGIKSEIDALKKSLDGLNGEDDVEVRKERLLQIQDLEVSLSDLEKLEADLNKKQKEEKTNLDKQKTERQTLDKKGQTLEAKDKQLKQDKAKAEQDLKKAEEDAKKVKTAKIEEAKATPEAKRDSTISNTQSTFNSVAGSVISNYTDDAVDLLGTASKASKVVKVVGKSAGFAGSAIDAGGTMIDYLKGNKTGAEATEAVGWIGADVAVGFVPVVGTALSMVGTQNIVNEYVEVTDKKEEAAQNRIAMMQAAGIDADTAETIDTVSDKSIDIMSSVFLTKELRVVAGAAERKITSVVEEFSPETAQTIHNGWQVVEDVTSMDPKKMAHAAKKIENKVESVTKSVKSAVSTGVKKAKNAAKTVAKKVLPKSVYNTASAAYHKFKSWF